MHGHTEYSRELHYTVLFLSRNTLIPLQFMSMCLRDSVTRIVFKLRLWGDRLGPTDVSDPNFIVLRCPFNLLRIF